MTTKEQQTIDNLFKAVQDLRTENQKFREDVKLQVESINAKTEKKHLPIFLEQDILKAAQQAINESVTKALAAGHGGGMHFDMDIIFQMPRGKNNGGFMDTKSPTITSNSFEHNNYVITRSPPDSGVIQLVDNNESGGIQPYQQNRVYYEFGKSPALLSESGTTGIVAAKLDRRYILIEKEKCNIDLIKKRFNIEIGLFA